MQLAEQAGISISYLSKIEAAGCDKSLSISALNQIAKVSKYFINALHLYSFLVIINSVLPYSVGG